MRSHAEHGNEWVLAVLIPRVSGSTTSPMNWLVYHFASGQSFFTGVALVIIAALASGRPNRIAERVAIWAFLAGAAAIALASAAIPYWCYAIAVCATVAWIVSMFVHKWQRWTPYAVIAVWLAAAALEAPYHIAPTLEPAPARAVTVIADSITAGMGADDKSVRWPDILAKERNLQVQDLAHVGETAASALRRVKERGIDAPVVVLEIGGNDLLGSTSSAQFARDLDALLARVCAGAASADV